MNVPSEFLIIVLKIIHGHKHGSRIKDTIRANVFLKETARNGYKIISKNYSDPGVSIFRITQLPTVGTGRPVVYQPGKDRNHPAPESSSTVH